MRDRQPVAARAVARRPDDLPQKRATSEDSVHCDFGFVYGALIHVDTERCAHRHSRAKGGRRAFQHGEQRLGVGAVFVGDWAATRAFAAARFAGFGPRDHFGAHPIRWIEVDEIEIGPVLQRAASNARFCMNQRINSLLKKAAVWCSRPWCCQFSPPAPLNKVEGGERTSR